MRPPASRQGKNFNGTSGNHTIKPILPNESHCRLGTRSLAMEYADRLQKPTRYGFQTQALIALVNSTLDSHLISVTNKEEMGNSTLGLLPTTSEEK